MFLSRCCTVLGLGFLFVAVSPVLAQESADMVPKPTKEHALLKKDVGTWDATVKAWMGPGDPHVSKGKEVNAMLPGDLWILSAFDGDFGGMAFHGRGQFGYDTNKKKYVGTWIDSMSTTPMLMEGTYDESKQTMTMTSDTVGQDGKPVKTKSVTENKPDGSRVFTMYMKSDATGPDFVKMMEITYTRNKDAAAK
jgi:hypothetical protein